MDNIIFHCWGSPEKDSFLKMMKRLKFSNVSVFDDTVLDCYDVGRSDTPINFYPYSGQMKFWGKFNPKEYILISQGEAAVFDYSWKNFLHLCTYFSQRGEQVHYLATLFEDVFFPTLTKDVINIMSSVPDSLKGIDDPRIDRDKLRTDLCEILGLVDIPMQKSYINWNISEKRKKQMIDLYNKSQFKKDYKFNINFDNACSTPHTFDSRVWAFAVTVYEKIFNS